MQNGDNHSDQRRPPGPHRIGQGGTVEGQIDERGDIQCCDGEGEDAHLGRVGASCSDSDDVKFFEQPNFEESSYYI